MKTKLTELFTEFIKSEQASGIMLIFCTILSIAIANSDFGGSYLDFWHTAVGIAVGDAVTLRYSLIHWVNDGLMTFFFLLVGLEIEREFYIGELSKPKNASLPIIAALGGMVIPALIHFLFNHGTATQGGAGIPMATDIAFAVGILALLGNRVPLSLKIFLTALAIIDDLGAVVVIALFYVGDFSLMYLLLALGAFAVMVIFNRLGILRLPFYLIPGLIMWYFMLKSGVHAAIAGVFLAFAVPFRNGKEQSPSYKLQHFLNRPVAFIVMPLFALANTGIVLTGNWVEGLAATNSSGIIAGLFFGKPLGIFLFSLLAVKAGLSKLPDNISWKHIIGAGFLGGIGFTMSIFITLLAFGDNAVIVTNSKIAILLGSLAASTVGFLILHRRNNNMAAENDVKRKP